jgi:hypothetical protein
MKNIIFAIIALAVVAGGAYYVITSMDTTDVGYEKPDVATSPDTTPQTNDSDVAVTETESVAATSSTERGPMTIIGTSVSGKEIAAYHFGTGERELLLIGGIHGGYSWNTALLAYEVIDWLAKNPTTVPEGVTVTVIPTLNPDGLIKVTGKDGAFVKSDVKGGEAERVAARFNANNVDLNRNFDCEWKESGTWQNRTVSGGSAPFSEPETAALKAYVAKHEPAQVIAWYSAAGGVYASQCGETTLAATRSLTNRFAAAAGYSAHEEFDYYEITGDMMNWFAKLEIPAISVLLTTHDTTEFSKNKAGVEAVLKTLGE